MIYDIFALCTSIRIHIYIYMHDLYRHRIDFRFLHDTDMFSFPSLDLIAYSLTGTLSLIPSWVIFLIVSGYQEHSESDTDVVGSSCGRGSSTVEEIEVNRFGLIL